MSHAPQWRFRRMAPAEINQDPVQGEFFTSTSDLAERLVRESIQNSLDAARGDGPVRVRFAFSGEDDALPPEQAARYLAGLKEHLGVVALEGEEDAVYDAYDLIDKCLPMTYLVVEDLGTEGLTGDVEGNTELEEGNRFWGFFRSIGISPNPDGTGGSWGLGKWVFPDASRINAYLGITRRSDEQRHLLMGMAILKTHHINDEKYPPYGQFAIRSDEPDATWLPLPIDSEDDPGNVIETAISDFRLDRDNGPGLSVVIPWPNDELMADDIVRAVLTQYFLPIVDGKLDVEVVADGQIQRIDAGSIATAAAHIGASDRDDDDRDSESPESLVKAIGLARWASELDESSLIDLKATLQGDILADQDVEALRERFGRGERLGFRLSTDTTDKKNEEVVPASFCVYLEWDDDLPQGHDYFVRGHLRIPERSHISNFHARALVLVDAKSRLGDLLRDAEGPAHFSWNPHADRLRKRWIGGYGRVQQVRRAAPLLLRTLTELPRERLKNLLVDLFPAPTASGSGPGPHPPPPPPPASASPVSIGNLEDGFSVRSDPTNPGAEELAGTTWNLAFAYDVARGGQRAAFTSFQRGFKQGAPDFDLFGGHLRVACGGCRYTIDSPNEIQIKITESDFHLSVRGLDARDVIVDLHKQVNDAEPEEDDE